MSKPPSIAPSPGVATEAQGSVPSFNAVRRDGDDNRELRRNQTVQMEYSLRRELAVHELPSLPAGLLRSTGEDMGETLKGLSNEADVEETTRPGRLKLLRRQGRFVFGGVMMLSAVTAVLVTLRLRDVPTTMAAPSQPMASVVTVVANPGASARVGAVPTVPSRVPETSAVTPKTSAPSKAVSNASKTERRDVGKRRAVKSTASGFDPNELMFKPQ
jgi:hypothetical protein